MRAAMAAAEVGDDQYGEDPTTNELQRRTAEILGKEAALWMPSGTMANQVAMRVLTRPGDEVVIACEAHVGWHEAGGAAANAGVQLVEIGRGGVFTPGELAEAIKPSGLPVFPATTVMAVENTHNRAGGVVFPQPDVERLCEMACDSGLATYLDGARLWNASVASGIGLAGLAAPFDLVSVAFSKGLGAPGGSVLAGSAALIGAADRHRRRMGGAMRQTGILAAAAMHGLDRHFERLADDHANARILAERLATATPVRIDLATVQTNIVVFDLPSTVPVDADGLVARARERGVLLNAFARRRVRAVTHLDVTAAECVRAADVLAAILERE
jgi:threonine aldolase